MKGIRQRRDAIGTSQRDFALRAGLAYKSLQLIEGDGHDPRLSSLQSIAHALGYPKGFITASLDRAFALPPDSIGVISARLSPPQNEAWKLWLFNFVDAFRRTQNLGLILEPPVLATPDPQKALLTATVETLCDECALSCPWWCEGMPVLAQPWFPAAIENLKASALLESPIHFRKRNIFVLGNFLSRT